MIEFYAYVAGIMDGEGCFMLFKHTNKKCKSGYSWQIKATIAQNNREYLEELRSELNMGQIVKVKNKNSAWISFSANHLRKLLPKIIPYLRIKKQQAILLLEATKITKKVRKGRGKFRSEILNKKLEEIESKLKALKRQY